MGTTSSRVLRLLSLLQLHRDWTSAELATRLEVTERTVRRDVERLRELGYVVGSTRGPAGGYRLAAGSELPPLLLDDEEAVAIAVGLSTAVRSPVTGIAEASVRALAKLAPMLPPRLRSRISALGDTTVAVPPDSAESPIDAELLSTLATAARDHQVLRFDYTSHDGELTLRRVEPHKLVVWDRRWYLLAWDAGRGDWRRFRVDRVGRVRTPTGPRFAPREPPGDIAESVARDVAAAGFRHRARIVVHAPASRLAARLPAAVGRVERLDDARSVLETGADSLETIAVYLGMLDADFEIADPPELVAHVRRLAERYRRGASAAQPPSR